jgi:hypothetical protein
MNGQNSYSSADVKELVEAAVRAAVQEANKPKPKTEQELAEIEQAQLHRKETAEQYKAQQINKRWLQENGCTHEHKKSAGGGTHCVHVLDNDHPGDPGFVFCQNCEGRFRPDTPKWRKLDPAAIFDTAKFNTLFQSCAQAQGEIIG